MEKSKKPKNSFLSLYCVCPVARTAWHSFPKIPKIIFLSLFVSVRPFASCDTYFQAIQKIPKIQFSKYKCINIFKQKCLLRTTWSLILHREIRRSKASPCQVHLQNQIIFSIVFQIVSPKELRNPDFSFWMRIRRTKVNPCRAQKN